MLCALVCGTHTPLLRMTVFTQFTVVGQHSHSSLRYDSVHMFCLGMTVFTWFTVVGQHSHSSLRYDSVHMFCLGMTVFTCSA
jgi:hypothetical protein